MKVTRFLACTIVAFLTYFSNMQLYAQTQGSLKQAKLGFAIYACPKSDFNSFRVNISWKPPFPNADNKYFVELSDADGNFDNPTILSTITDKNNRSEIPVTFQFPSTTQGKKYKIRVRSTSPSNEVVAFWEAGGNRGKEIEVHYQDVTTQITVSPINVTLCSGHTQELKVTALPGGKNPSNYKYKWYKLKEAGSSGNNILLASDAPPTQTVSEAGKYYAEIDYGACSGATNARSANITVGVSGNQTVTLSSSSTAICTNDAFTLTATPPIAGSKYFWYYYASDPQTKTKIAETDNNTYTVNAPDNKAGKYYVEVGSGGNCDVRSNQIAITRKDDITATLNTTGGSVLMPGKNKTFTVSTTAEAPTYKWFKDGTEISGETGATLVTTSAGKYKAEVSQTGSCPVTVQTAEYELTQPDNFKVSIKTKSAYQDCTYDRVTLTVDKIIAQIGSNEVTVDPADYSFFTFQWQANITGTYANVGTNAKEITLSSALENGKYKLNITGPNYSSIPESNEISVLLKDANALKINGGVADLEYCGASVTLTVTTGANASSTYTWYKDGAQVAQGVGLTEYSTEGSGSFYVSVSANYGGCPATSAAIVVRKKNIVVRWEDDMGTREIFYVGKTNELKVSHNMESPTIEWTKNGTVLTGETGTSLTISTAPTSVDIYQVKLTDTGTCGNTVTLGPVYFETISDIQQLRVGTVASVNCETRTQTTLELQQIKVKLSSSGEEVIVKKSDYRYFSFQWAKDGNDVYGETNPTYVVSSAGNSDAAQYTVRVIYNTSIIKVSDPKTIAFTPIPDFEISSSEGAKTTAYLCPGGSLTLTVASDSFDPSSSVADSFSYKWYKVTSANYRNDTALGSEQPTATVSETGEYYLEINNGGCPKRAHIKVENYRTGNLKIKQITATGALAKEINQHSSARERKLDVNVGQQLVADGGNNFVWAKSDGTVTYGSTLRITSKDMAGTYTLKEESCTAVGANTLDFELNIFEVKVIPNIVTPNADGVNDYWVIPDMYCQPNVRVTIYSQEGKEVLSTTNYQNNWPDSTTYKELGKRSLVFIYVIEGGNVEKQKGVITLLK